MAKEAFLPLFFGDFLASTAEWEGEERALYLLLLCYQWSLGSLPGEPRRICKMAGWDSDAFDRHWPTVSLKFPQVAGRRTNARLEEHRTRSKEISEKRAIAGARGGATTQAKAKQLPDDTKAIASNLPGHPSHPIPSQSDPSEPDSEKSKRGEGNASRKRSATATRLPADFELTESRRAIATTEGVDPEREFSKFSDYWRAASGANARKHDWDATWRNWCRKAQDLKPRANGTARRVYRDAPTTAELEALEAARAGK